LQAQLVPRVKVRMQVDVDVLRATWSAAQWKTRLAAFDKPECHGRYHSRGDGMMKRSVQGACVFMGLLLGVPAGFAQDMDGMSRQDDVARKGARVVPFDLACTAHHFDDTATGGVEAVAENDASDTRQIGLIRSHLAHEATRFGRGDFSDPATIHGRDMPGLAALAAAGDKLRVSYETLPAGARLSYSSGDAAVIDAINAWFAAQRSDHAAHEHHHP
jgi:hypothetical protein